MRDGLSPPRLRSSGWMQSSWILQLWIESMGSLYQEDLDRGEWKGRLLQLSMLVPMVFLTLGSASGFSSP
jgi:hypothetical protein